MMIFRPHSFSLAEKNLGIKVIPMKGNKINCNFDTTLFILLKIKNVPKHIKEE